MEKRKPPASTAVFRSKSRHERHVNAWVYTLLTGISILWLLPLVLLLLQSFRGESGGQVAYVLPRQWTLKNYAFLFEGARWSIQRLYHTPSALLMTLLSALGAALLSLWFLKKPFSPFAQTPSRLKHLLLLSALWFLLQLVRCLDVSRCDFLQWYRNTLIIAIFCAALQTLMVLSVAYTLSRMRFRGRRLMMNAVLVLGMFPGFLTMIVLYYLLKTLGLTQAGAVPGLILISVASSGMGYYIAKGFFDTIPRALDESARMDGATRLNIFLKIILPMAKPIVIYTVLMGFLAPWGDYVFASYVAFGHKAGYNVAVGLYRWVNTSDYQGYFTRFCAGGVLVALPVTALFMWLQKYYVEGITAGAVKG